MTYFEIIDLFTFYGVDVAALGILTCGLTQILKTTVFKKAPNKVYTFLPFALGIALYFGYAAVAHTELFGSAEYIAYIFERGLSVGAAATMVYVIYEQFVKGKYSDPYRCAVTELLKGYFDGEKLGALAEKITAACLGEREKAQEAVEKLLISEAAGELSAEEIKILARIIAKTLERLNTSTAN